MYMYYASDNIHASYVLLKIDVSLWAFHHGVGLYLKCKCYKHPTYESLTVAIGDSVGALTGELMERSRPLFSPTVSNPEGDKPPPIV